MIPRGIRVKLLYGFIYDGDRETLNLYVSQADLGYKTYKMSTNAVHFKISVGLRRQLHQNIQRTQNQIYSQLKEALNLE